MYFCSFFFRLLSISFFFYICLCSDDEERLVRNLFRGYNKLIRPVINSSDRVLVNLSLSFTQLLSVNERNQVMKSNVWMNLHWNDYQLKWDKYEYDGIEAIRLPSDKVWKPDIVLFNNADGNYEVRYKSNVVITSDGLINWIPPAIFLSSCAIDVTYFPFDQQTCSMKFGSWTFNGDQVGLAFPVNESFIDLSDYGRSGTWDIIDVPAYLNTYKDKNKTETDITFYLIIRRKTLFYTVNLILPTVLISFLCVLVFYLPAEANEKVTLGISILLSLVVFLLLVSKILPPTSLVLPLISKYLLFTFIMNTFSILTTVIILNWNFRSPRTHAMSKFVRQIFLKILPKILCMQRPKKTRLRWMMERPNINIIKNNYSQNNFDELTNNISNINDHNKIETVELNDLHHPNCIINRDAHVSTIEGSSTINDNTYNDFDIKRDSITSDSVTIGTMATKAFNAVEFISEHLKNEDLFIQTREDWKYVAMVIDRLQLYIFFFVTTFGTITILMDAPHIFEYVDQEKLISMYTKNKSIVT